MQPSTQLALEPAVQKTPMFVIWISILNGFDAITAFRYSLKWFAMIPSLQRHTGTFSTANSAGMWALVLTIAIGLFGLGCVAIVLSVALDLRREWARKFTIVLYCLSGVVLMLSGRIPELIIPVVVIGYLCTASVKTAFRTPEPIPEGLSFLKRN